MPRQALAAAIIAFVIVLVATGVIDAQDQIGYLRIESLDFPRQVAPGAEYQVSMKFAYAFHSEQKIKSAIYAGSIDDAKGKLWESESMLLNEGGTKTLKASLRAPGDATTLGLTAYIMVFNNTWIYFSDPERGPGFKHFTIKVSQSSTITVSIGFPNAPVTIDGREFFTNMSGQLSQSVPFMSSPRIDVPETIQVGDRTRAIFREWSDGNPSRSRTVSVMQDMVLEALYQKQHFLDVKSQIGKATGSGWYNEGDVAHFAAEEVIPFEGVMGWLGAKYVFQTWTGDSNVRASEVAIVMDAPYVAEAVYESDYSTTWLYTIFALMAVIGAVIGTRLGGRSREGSTLPPAVEAAEEPTEQAELLALPPRHFCIYCGSELEDKAEYCSKCGRTQND